MYLLVLLMGPAQPPRSVPAIMVQTSNDIFFRKLIRFMGDVGFNHILKAGLRNAQEEKLVTGHPI
jgi:hypothetical protein